MSAPEAKSCEPRPNPTLVLLAAWLVPGAGAWLLGRRARGIAYFLALGATFLFGLRITEGHAVSVREHPVVFAVELPAGIVALAPAISELLRDAGPPGRLPSHLVGTIDLGFLFCMVAGLLNLLLAADAYERATRRCEEAAS